MFPTAAIEGAMQTDALQPNPSTRQPHSLIASDRGEGTSIRWQQGRNGSAPDDRQAHWQCCLCGPPLRRLSRDGQKHLPIPWLRLSYDRTLGAYQIDLTDEELRRAPSFGADQEFDWGDRSQEIEIHNYYKTPPYWGAY